MGRIKGTKSVTKNGVDRIVCPDILKELLKEGWKLGRVSFSKEWCQNISKSQKDKNNSMFGKHHTEESNKKNSELHKGKIPWNKGIPASEELKRKNSESHKGIPCSEEVKRKLSESLTGRIRSEEVREKLGIPKGRKYIHKD